MVVYKDEDFFRGTDYTAEDVKALLNGGAIPTVFITEFPDGTMQLNGIIGVVLKAHPKVKGGATWLQTIGDILHALADDPDAMKKIEEKSSEYLYHESKYESPAIETVYYDKDELSAWLKTSPDKLHRLLHWVFTEHREHFEPWIIEDTVKGYMVSLPLINQFKRQGQDFENFLKDVVMGRVNLSENE